MFLVFISCLLNLFSYLDGPQSSFEKLVKNMNFQNLPKTLPSVKKIIHVQSRFRQFKRYIDQGIEHESKQNNSSFKW